jgi:hypothetical protein
MAYVNGIKQSGIVDISSVTGKVINSGSVGYNNISDVAGWYIKGSIDNVRIYSAVLTLGQIQQHYLAGLEKHQQLTMDYEK